jgi:hypothetical protein
MPGLRKHKHLHDRDAKARAQPAAIEDPSSCDEIHCLFDSISASHQLFLLPFMRLAW